ncbi:MAG: SDR family NAD(P)-dependent oxidoreductase [Thermoanaerobaculia bacterium]
MKNVLITGGSSGIGLALGRELARRGNRVALCARRGELLEEVASELRAQGREALAIRCDVTSSESVHEAVQRVHSEWGRIDIAVANAGVGLPTPARKFKLEDAENVFRTNVLGMVYLFDAVIPSMIERGDGQFVGIASVAGFRGLPGSSAYSASKAAMQAFLDGTRAELRSRGVKVTTVNPGFVRTPLVEKNRFPMPFLMEPEEAALKIAEAIEREVREVSFPLPTALLMKLARLLPNAVYDMLSLPFAKRRIDSAKLRR